jgi:hypothetical protein
MEVIIKHGCPIAFDSALGAWVFMLLPAVLAGLGAFLLQGSFLRIVGGALGAGLRDFFVLIAVSSGWITVTNPHWEDLVSAILIFFCASGGALGSCLAPYRGKLLFLNSAIGGFLGQFCLPFVLLKNRANQRAV